MRNLTLVIPAKHEEYSLPKVLEEVQNIDCKKIIVLSKSDSKTIRSIKNYKCKIIKQKCDGYGNAIIEGIKNVTTKYLCIFNADGSFDPKYLKKMLNEVRLKKKFIFASRYIQGGGSADDSPLTFIGNKIFTFLSKQLLKIKLSDVLFTYVLCNVKSFKKLKFNGGYIDLYVV